MKKVYGNTTKDIETFKNIKNMNIYFEQITMRKALARKRKSLPLPSCFIRTFSLFFHDFLLVHDHVF